MNYFKRNFSTTIKFYKISLFYMTKLHCYLTYEYKRNIIFCLECGLFNWRPKWLQSCARGWVIVLLMITIRLEVTEKIKPLKISLPLGL